MCFEHIFVSDFTDVVIVGNVVMWKQRAVTEYCCAAVIHVNAWSLIFACFFLLKNFVNVPLLTAALSCAMAAFVVGDEAWKKKREFALSFLGLLTLDTPMPFLVELIVVGLLTFVLVKIAERKFPRRHLVFFCLFGLTIIRLLFKTASEEFVFNEAQLLLDAFDRVFDRVRVFFRKYSLISVSIGMMCLLMLI